MWQERRSSGRRPRAGIREARRTKAVPSTPPPEDSALVASPPHRPLGDWLHSRTPRNRQLPVGTGRARSPPRCRVRALRRSRPATGHPTRRLNAPACRAGRSLTSFDRQPQRLWRIPCPAGSPSQMWNDQRKVVRPAGSPTRRATTGLVAFRTRAADRRESRPAHFRWAERDVAAIARLEARQA